MLYVLAGFIFECLIIASYAYTALPAFFGNLSFKVNLSACGSPDSHDRSTCNLPNCRALYCSPPHSTTTGATFYGKDGWSIHTGSCMFGYLDETAGTGWDTAAISDAAWDYSGSCGKCKEVKCKATGFRDGYGQWLDRKDACFDTSASVVVTITDTCPCSYPGNYYSNKRWCCGDMYHM
jgi:hypothetical protein